MARTRALAASLAGVALLAVAYAASAFVTPSSGSRAASQLRRSALANDVLPAELDMTPAVAEPEVREEEAAPASFLKWVGAGLLAGMMMAVLSAPVEAIPYQEPLEGFHYPSMKLSRNLEPCSKNKLYQKREKNALFKLQKRAAKYKPDGIVAKRYAKRIENLKTRFATYSGRYCSVTDGLPKVIASGEIVRGGVLVPGIMFLYIAGWIGWAGREYLLRTGEGWREIFIDVPLALQCMASGFAWPVNSWQDIVNGRFVVKEGELWYQALPRVD